jgi:hypothetical protein
VARANVAVLALALPLAALVACGDRTGLIVGATEQPTDASVDAPLDREPPPRDVALDPIDDELPSIDAAMPDVARPNDCPDGAATLVYVVTEQNELYSFDPPSLAFTLIGGLACPSNGATPWSMAVDRTGIAYSVFNDGNLFRIDTATAACAATPFVPGQLGFTTFGMGFVAAGDASTETLYVTESTFNTYSKGLATLDLQSWSLSMVGAYQPPIPRAELTGTADGRLFAYYPELQGSGSHIAEIDRATAQVTAQDNLQTGGSQDAFAFAFWGGDFWVFTSTGGPSTVTRYRPSDNSETDLATMPSTIVGAGVSTCAPQ